MESYKLELALQMISDMSSQINETNIEDESVSMISLIDLISEGTKSYCYFAFSITSFIMVKTRNSNEQNRMRIFLFVLIGRIVKAVRNPYRSFFEKQLKTHSQTMFDGFDSHELFQIKDVVSDWIDACILSVMVTNDLLLEIYDRLEEENVPFFDLESILCEIKVFLFSGGSGFRSS
jgi:type III secretory pathway component EscR